MVLDFKGSSLAKIWLGFSRLCFFLGGKAWRYFSGKIFTYVLHPLFRNVKIDMCGICVAGCSCEEDVLNDDERMICAAHLLDMPGMHVCTEFLAP